MFSFLPCCNISCSSCLELSMLLHRTISPLFWIFLMLQFYGSRDLISKNDGCELCFDWVTSYGDSSYKANCKYRDTWCTFDNKPRLLKHLKHQIFFFSEGRRDAHVNINTKHVWRPSCALLRYRAALYTDAEVRLVWGRTLLTRRNNSVELMSSHFPIGNILGWGVSELFPFSCLGGLLKPPL